MLRVRRSTFVPGWAVPPRVLLVDDDAVSRKLSSKFLQIFGCTIDVAVDGVGAVNKMNLEKYDLVLMVRFCDPPHPFMHWFVDGSGRIL
jgi:osomolarity two-component system response regulator SKN7